MKRNIWIVCTLGVFAVSAAACGGEDPGADRTIAEPTGSVELAVTACTHPICSAGTKLISRWDPCAPKICAVDNYCCSTSWDSVCVGEVASICGQCSPCGTAPPPNTCSHPMCSTG